MASSGVSGSCHSKIFAMLGHDGELPEWAWS